MTIASPVLRVSTSIYLSLHDSNDIEPPLQHANKAPNELGRQRVIENKPYCLGCPKNCAPTCAFGRRSGSRHHDTNRIQVSCTLAAQLARDLLCWSLGRVRRMIIS